MEALATQRRRLAAATLVLVAAVAVLLFAAGDGPSRREATATFTDVRGLVAGAEVRAGGVKVGEVRRVRLGAGARPVVTLAIDRSFPLRADATAAVRLGSLSGEFNRYVSITEGTGAPLPGGPVRLRAVSSPVEVDQALEALDPRTRADVHAVLAGLAGALGRRGPQVARTLRSSAAALEQSAGVAGDLAADGAALRGLVADSRRITAALGDRPQRLAALVDELGAVLRTTARREDALDRAVAGLPAALREPRRALAEVRAAVPDLRAAVHSAAPALAQLVPASGELRSALTAAGPALAQTRGLTATAPEDLRALTPLLRDARPFLARLTPVLRRSGPMLDQARVRLPDFFSFFANWADFTSNYDANGHGARVGLVLPPAPTTTLPPSSDGAGQLAPPYLRTPGSLAGVPWTDYAGSFVAGGTAGPDVRRAAR